MNLDFDNTAYDKAYLEDVMSVHGLFFVKLAENKKYDLFSMIDVYMQHSRIRRKMDEGNWSALNKGYKQLLNDVDYALCIPKTQEFPTDGILLGWMADIYVLFQWRYNISSAEISRKMPARRLYGTYDPLHETSYNNACEKLHHKYFE